MGQRNPSRWALKYGTVNPGDLNSGYTPLALTFPSIGPSGRSVVNSLAVENFQRHELNGFTSTELAQLDCLPTRELRPGNLQNLIMPLFQRQFWEVLPPKPDFTRTHLYPLDNGNGMWTATNDVVWAIMEAPLSLTSRMLMSVHLLPWFDALLFGERYQVPEHRIRDEDKWAEEGEVVDFDELEMFWRRDSKDFDPSVVATERDKVFLKLQNNFGYRFGFMDSHVEHPTGPEENEHNGYAFALTFTNRFHMMYDTHIPQRSRRVYTYLDLNTPEKLFRTDLNSAERMQIEWHIANTLVHEVMHAVGFLFSDLNDRPDKFELYFENEPMAELGYSYEAAMNIGQTEEMIPLDNPHPYPPLGFWLRRHWPDITDVVRNDPGQPILIDPGVATTNDIYPIPLTFYQDMQQEEFWDIAVRAYGASLLHYRSVKEGTRLVYQVTKGYTYKSFRGKRISFLEHPFQILNDNFRSSISALTSAVTMTPDERKAVLFGKLFLMSSNLEQEFWHNSQQQKEQVESMEVIMAQADTRQFTSESRQAANLALLSFARQAIENHERLIAGILSMEELNGTTYPDRRLALREWNRGTRVFLRRLDTVLRTFLQNAENELLALEHARMVLWNPLDSTTEDDFDWDEIQTIMRIRRLSMPADNTLIRTLSEEIINAPEVSLVGECYARLFLFELDKELADGWADRHKCVRLVQYRLEYLVPAAPRTWRQLIDEMKEACSLAIRCCQSSLVAPGTNCSMQPRSCLE